MVIPYDTIALDILHSMGVSATPENYEEVIEKLEGKDRKTYDILRWEAEWMGRRHDDLSPLPEYPLGRKLREVREERKVSMRDIAKLLNCDVVHVSDIERGKVELAKEEQEKISEWIWG